MISAGSVTLDLVALAALMAAAALLGAGLMAWLRPVLGSWDEARQRMRWQSALKARARDAEPARSRTERPDAETIARILRRASNNADQARAVQTWLEGEGFIMIDPEPAHARQAAEVTTDAEFEDYAQVLMLPAPGDAALANAA